MNDSVIMSSRQMFRNVIILACILLFALSYFAFRYGQQIRMDIQTLDFERIALLQELQNTARRSANLAELDSLTISEADATRLNIMRHLGLEQNDYDFEVMSRQVRQVGEVELYTREATLRTKLSYAESLNLIDRLYNTGKIAIKRVELRASPSFGDVTEMTLVGNLYALRKDGQEMIPVMETVPVAVPASATAAVPQPPVPPVAGALQPPAATPAESAPAAPVGAQAAPVSATTVTLTVKAAP